MVEPVTELVLEAPAGLVRVRARVRRTATWSGSRSRTCRRSPLALDAPVEVPGVGTLRVDVAYGGAFCAFVDAAALGFAIVPDEARELAELGERIRPARRRAGRRSPTRSSPSSRTCPSSSSSPRRASAATPATPRSSPPAGSTARPRARRRQRPDRGARRAAVRWATTYIAESVHRHALHRPRRRAHEGRRPRRGRPGDHRPRLDHGLPPARRRPHRPAAATASSSPDTWGAGDVDGLNAQRVSPLTFARGRRRPPAWRPARSTRTTSRFAGGLARARARCTCPALSSRDAEPRTRLVPATRTRDAARGRGARDGHASADAALAARSARCAAAGLERELSFGGATAAVGERVPRSSTAPTRPGASRPARPRSPSRPRGCRRSPPRPPDAVGREGRARGSYVSAASSPSSQRNVVPAKSRRATRVGVPLALRRVVLERPRGGVPSREAAASKPVAQLRPGSLNQRRGGVSRAERRRARTSCPRRRRRRRGSAAAGRCRSTTARRTRPARPARRPAAPAAVHERRDVAVDRLVVGDPGAVGRDADVGGRLGRRVLGRRTVAAVGITSPSSAPAAVSRCSGRWRRGRRIVPSSAADGHS